MVIVIHNDVFLHLLLLVNDSVKLWRLQWASVFVLLMLLVYNHFMLSDNYVLWLLFHNH